jgi:hypothetical protein
LGDGEDDDDELLAPCFSDVETELDRFLPLVSKLMPLSLLFPPLLLLPLPPDCCCWLEGLFLRLDRPSLTKNAS